MHVIEISRRIIVVCLYLSNLDSRLDALLYEEMIEVKFIILSLVSMIIIACNNLMYQAVPRHSSAM